MASSATNQKKKDTKRKEVTFIFPGFEVANTTPVPDVVFDVLLARLTGAQFKVLMYIIRRTYGFKKTEDAISFSQFEHGITTKEQIENGVVVKEAKVLDLGCGLHRETLSKALQDLEEMGCIVSEKRTTSAGDPDTTHYKIHFAGEVVGKSDHPKKPQKGSRKIRPGVVGKSDRGSRKIRPGVVGKSDQQEAVRQETVLQETVRQEVVGDTSTNIRLITPPSPASSPLFSSFSSLEEETDQERIKSLLLIQRLNLPVEFQASELLLTFFAQCLREHSDFDLFTQALESLEYYKNQKKKKAMTPIWLYQNLEMKIKSHRPAHPDGGSPTTSPPARGVPQPTFLPEDEIKRRNAEERAKRKAYLQRKTEAEAATQGGQ